MNTTIERTQFVGSGQRMVGVITEPAEALGPAQRPLMVILNSGIIHRVGPNRLGVLLARELAACGHRVLRFDLSGIGDSEPRSDGLAPLDASLADIREALDWAEALLGADRFVLVGLCSGADHAVIYSGSDRRVVGMVIMDPTVPPTLKFHLRRLVGRLANAGLWRRVFTGKTSAWQRWRTLSRGETRPAKGPDPGSAEVRQYLENAYRQALADSREALAIFTDGMPARHNYPEQLRDALPGVEFGSRCRFEYFRGADHTFTDESLRDRLVALVGAWSRATWIQAAIVCAMAMGLGIDCSECLSA